jgi:hypothetical protein
LRGFSTSDLASLQTEGTLAHFLDILFPDLQSLFENGTERGFPSIGRE